MADAPGPRFLRRAVKQALPKLFPRRDLTCILGHGLGNQLFQIAGTYALAADRGVGVVLDEEWPYRPYFEVPDEWFAGRVATLRSRNAVDYVTEIAVEDRQYLQDLSLWGGREGEIRQLLRPSRRALGGAHAKYADILALPNKTAVHVRRGDYLDPAQPHRPCPPSYYETAAELVLADEPDTRFVVFSNDIEWCRRELPLRDPLFIEGNPDWLDLTLMTRCEHHICANSTFSWWGAFLSSDPSPIVPWLLGTIAESFRRIHPPHWRELVLEP